MKAAGHAKPATTWDYTVTDAQRERQHVARMLERLTATDAVADQDRQAASEKLMAEEARGPVQ